MSPARAVSLVKPAPTQVAVTGREGKRPSSRFVSRRRLYVPCLVIAAAAAVLIVNGWVTRWGGANFVDTVATLRVVAIGPVTVAVIAVLMVAERRWPAQPHRGTSRGVRHDALYALLNATLTLPLVAALSLSFASAVRHSLPWLVFPHWSSFPHGLVIALIFVLMDGCNWAAHLANHRVNALWRFHEVHHSQEEMSVLTVFRTHPLVHIAYIVALVPGVVLIANGGIPTALLVGYGAVVALAHSNLPLGFGPLERVFVSPNFHRVHHRLEGRQDVNLGFALSLWDHLFGTAVSPASCGPSVATGLAGRPLPEEFSGTRARHWHVFAQQLLAPFTRPARLDSYVKGRRNS